MAYTLGATPAAGAKLRPLVCFLSLIVTVLMFFSRGLQSHPHIFKDILKPKFAHKNCQPKTKIGFVKTHKTAST